MLGQRRTQALEVPKSQRHRAAARDSVGGVREADEPLAVPVLEQLDE